MAKTKVSTSTKPKSVVINDFGIQIRSLDRTPKDLAKWRSALQSAENVFNPNRRQLYELYEDTMLDEHLTSVTDQRKLSITNSSLVFQNNGKEVEAVQQLINTLAFENLLNYIVDSKLYGYSLIYADFIAKDGPQIELVPRMNVVPQYGLVVSQPGDMNGYNYQEPPYSNLYLGVGDPNNLGLLLKAAPLVLLKRGNVSDWAQFNEVFGQPIRKGEYDPYDPQQKVQMDKAMENMGSKPWINVPKGAGFEVLGNYQSASADTYKKLTDHFDEAISKLIVGQTMTTESGSSLSQSEVHERVSGKIGASDRRFVLKVLESRIKPMLLAQGIAAEGNFQFIEEEEQLSKKDRLAGDIQIHQAVGPLTKEYFAKEYNVEFVDLIDQEPGETEPEEDSQEDKPDKPQKGSKQKNLANSLLATLQNFFLKAPTR